VSKKETNEKTITVITVLKLGLPRAFGEAFAQAWVLYYFAESGYAISVPNALRSRLEHGVAY